MKASKSIKTTHGWKFPLGIFLVMLLTLWGWMVLIRSNFPHDQAAELISRPYLGISPEQNPLLEVWQRWDVLQYENIALHGYNPEKLEPYGLVYPTMMRLGAFFTGGSTLLAGLMISSFFCLVGISAFQNLARMELGEERLARNALLYLLLFPSAFFLFAPYSESTFMAGAILCLYYLRKRAWVSAGLWGMLAASVRLQAALLVIPVLYAAWIEWRQTKSNLPWISPLLVGLGAAIFPLYAWIALRLPPWEIFSSLGGGFNRTFAFPGLNLIQAVRRIIAGISPLVNGPDLVFMLFFIFGTVLVWKRLPRIHSVYTTTFLLLYLSTVTSNYPLMSISRYGLALFPIFLAMATTVKKKSATMVIIAIFLTGLLFYSAQFALWGWAG